MSVILDALKKAQDERKRPAYGNAGGDEGPPKGSRRVFYVIAGAVVCAIFVVFFVLNLSRTQPPIVPRVAQQREMPPPPPIVPPKVTPEAPAAKPPEVPGKEAFPGLTAAPAQDSRKAEMTANAEPERKVRTKAPGAEVRVAKNEPASDPKKRPVAEPRKPVSKPEKVEETKAPAVAPGPESTVVVKRMTDDRIMNNYNNAIRAAEQGSNEEAKKLYLAVVADQPNNIEALNNLGVLAMSEGNTKEATFYFRRILEYRKDYAKAYNNLGIIAMRDGERKIAEEYFRKAIEVAPEGVEAYVNLAALLRAEKRLEEANRVVDAPLRRGFRGAQLYLSAALIKDELGQHEDAIKYYRYYLQTSSQKDDRRRVIERLAFLEENRSADGR